MDWIGWVYDPNAWVSLVTLTILEVVLGIDNVVFISILTGKLPEIQQAKARTTGLALALFTRILLLLCIKWLMGLTNPLFAVLSHEFSGKDLILIAGGLFLIAKSTQEIHARLEPEEDGKFRRGHSNFVGTIIQIVLLDIVFSLDSVITAVGLANDLPVMIAAITIAMILMLLADGVVQHIDRGYIYVAMAFSVSVEMLNLRVRSKGSKK